VTDQIETTLAGLRVPAPHGVLPNVLAATGLADRYVQRDSVVGPVYVAFGGDGVTRLDIAMSESQFESEYEEMMGRPVVKVDDVPPALVTRVDRAISEGRPGRLAVDLSSLTDFQQAVLRKTAEIPPGEVRPYGWVAREIGKPGAVRAVGTALARNPVPLIIPCHRVVRSDGQFGQYSLGDAANKPRLLREEGVDLEGLESLATRRVRYTGSDTTKIYCHPTCRHARRTMEIHQVEFKSEKAAEKAGYRACKVCRPAVAA